MKSDFSHNEVILQYFLLEGLIKFQFLQNSKFHFYSLKVKNYLNYRGSNFIGGKKSFAYYFANISNLLLHGNIDINLFANRLFLASMWPAILEIMEKCENC